MSSLKLWYVKCITLCTLLSTQLYLQMLSAVSHCAGSRPLTSATLINTESSRGYFSDILLFLYVTGILQPWFCRTSPCSCSWQVGRCWGGPTQSPDSGSPSCNFCPDERSFKPVCLPGAAFLALVLLPLLLWLRTPPRVSSREDWQVSSLLLPLQGVW